MKKVYPVIFSSGEDGLLAYIPDLEINAHGKDLPEAIEMARDAISIWCVSEQDDGRQLPEPSAIADISHDKDDIISLVDIDIDSYRRQISNLTIPKNLALPSWLNERAERAGINLSQFLQRALEEELHIKELSIAE
jgi:predicted RNase H-like HicB family nuclease